MYTVNQQVIARIQRCACVGGGVAEVIGHIIGFVNAPNGRWVQIAYDGGISTTKEEDIIRIIQ